MSFEFSYLFRYRDLVAATLDAHRAVLDEHGSCWWGWWMRPSEDGRLSVWQDLKRNVSNGPVEIGLFDSGDGSVYRAKIADVVVPAKDSFGTFAPVRPPAADDALIPEYYRHSNGSRAWMRIVELMNDPTPFFGEASFAEAPPLPHYSESVLARIEGKVILDAAELRSMDTTIWSVRPRVGGDSTERFIAASVGVSTPLSASPVHAPGEWILHLTDLHYSIPPHQGQHRWSVDSVGGGERLLADAVHDALRTHERQVAAVLVTGDLTFRALAGEFDIASRELFRLTNGLLGLSLDHLVVIPGNHDIAWSKEEAYSPEHPVEVAPAEATEGYRRFFANLYRYPSAPDLNMARRYVLPGGQLVDIVAVNSSSLEQGKNFLAGMGRIQDQAYSAGATELGWNLNQGSSLRILALHHHVALTEDLEGPEGYAKGFGIAVDAPHVLRRAAHDGVHLVLHGHKHRAFLWRSGAYELPERAQERWSLGSINILGGGSAGSTDVEAGMNYFHLLRYQSGTVEVEMYRSNRGNEFQRFSSWTASINTADISKRITPWKKMQ